MPELQSCLVTYKNYKFGLRRNKDNDKIGPDSVETYVFWREQGDSDEFLAKWRARHFRGGKGGETF